MNTNNQKSGRKPLYISLFIGSLMAASATAQAGTVCAEYDGDPQTEGNGTSSAAGEHAASCGRFNTATGDFAAAFGNANDANGAGSSAFGRVNEANGDESSALGHENFALTMMATSAAGQNNRNRLAVGTGYQHGSVALSIGYQRLIDEKSTFTIGGAIGAHGENTVGAGYGFGW